jgi:hypothetical protein
MAPAVFAQVPHYRVADSIIVGHAEGDFYTLDVRHRRLYGASQYVVDVDAKRVVGVVADTAASGGFVIASELGRGLVRNGIEFALASGTVEGRLAVRGDASLYDPFTGHGFLLGPRVSVIDLRTGMLVGEVPVPGAAESGVSDGTGRIYLNLMSKDSIAVLDARTLAVTAKYTVTPAKSSQGLAIDAIHHRLFAACNGQVAVLDAENGSVVAVIPASGQSDENAFDPSTDLLFEPGGEGKGLTIVHEESPNAYSVVQTIVGLTTTSVRAIVDPTTHFVYMPHYTADQRFAFIVLEPVR